MQTDMTKGEQETLSPREAKKSERRAAMAEIKRLHPLDPEKAREAARLWFEQNARKVDKGSAGNSAFHLRKISEADPERINKAMEAARKSEAGAERAQNASREVVKEWKKRNPNKVKKLNNLYRERQKSK